LQLRAGVNATPTQVAVAQPVPVAYRRHAPAPSQLPSVPQPGAPLSSHWFRGSVPAGTGVHVPRLPATAHERQVPVQLELQQIPCWHRPDAHSVPPAQVSPGAFRVHCPVRQTLGATQSVSAAQLVRQLPAAPQMYGAHGTAAGAWHAPAALQVEAGVCVETLQLGGAHVVPVGYRLQLPRPSHTPSVPQLAAP
jgi:hypothetical protein